MSSEVMKELHENAEHAKHDRSMVPVTLTMAILAVFVAAVSLLGHRAHTEEVILQDRITDGWAYYQAKNIRLNTDQMFLDLTSVLPQTDSGLSVKLRSKYANEVAKYVKEKADSSGQTKKLEAEAKYEKKRTNFYDLGEVLVEIALVVTSITLLSKQQAFWISGVIIGLAGLAITAFGLLAF